MSQMIFHLLQIIFYQTKKKKISNNNILRYKNEKKIENIPTNNVEKKRKIVNNN